MHAGLFARELDAQIVAARQMRDTALACGDTAAATAAEDRLEDLLELAARNGIAPEELAGTDVAPRPLEVPDGIDLESLDALADAV